MSRFWTFLIHAHSLAGPVTMLLWPLYASVIAIESPSKEDDEQWLAYWILYSFLTLLEMLIQPLLEWIPIWYDLKLALVAWLVLPQFRGAAFLYERFVREKIINRFGLAGNHQRRNKQLSPNGKGKNKSDDFIASKKVFFSSSLVIQNFRACLMWVIIQNYRVSLMWVI
ncbi:HVA22-like protein e [Impatiens glandulifera]|uniref:HVA22-like protein e n=1 Tax=Impatiens glandulifera TaxID=253017 RepID=UPI001FB0F10C|nr:HVA22-like protein e [Impatiens glandulifera]